MDLNTQNASPVLKIYYGKQKVRNLSRAKQAIDSYMKKKKHGKDQ